MKVSNIKEIVRKEANALLKNVELAKNIDIPVVQEFLISTLDNKKFDKTTFIKQFNDVFGEQDVKNCIYIITCDKFFSDWNLIVQNIKDLKSEGKHLSKINIEHKEFNEKNNEVVLYIGSKLNGIRKRITQHLGIDGSSRSTYSLYIQDWINTESVIIKVAILKFENIKDPLHLELLEDFLWEGSKPLFGKKGATFNRKAVK